MHNNNYCSANLTQDGTENPVSSKLLDWLCSPWPEVFYILLINGPLFGDEGSI